MATRGRKPGSLVNARCKCCGTIAQARGGANFRCEECRASGHYPPQSRFSECGTGKDTACLCVKRAIQSGELPHPKTLTCADCPAPAIEYDHRDYNKPLCVDPVCRRCNLKRGPAIPLDGTVAKVVARGYLPYRLRSSVVRILVAMGLPTTAINAMPAKLNIEHWRELLPLFDKASV